MKLVKVKNFLIGKGQPLAVMCGPCVIESEEHAMKTAEFLKELYGSLGLNLIYKSSYDKANRSSYHSFRGPGLEKGLKILEKIRKELDLPVITDVHSLKKRQLREQVCDILQIPAFLCRQTDLVTAAGKTGAVINVKKGQFMAPWDMTNVVDKIVATGNDQIILTDRGTSFGYNNLVSDMRTIPILQKLGYPVCFDASHSVQIPGGNGTSSGRTEGIYPHARKSGDCIGMRLYFLGIPSKSCGSQKR